MRRALRAVVSTIALTVLLTACGASDPVAAEDVSAAALKTTDAGSSRIESSGMERTPASQ